MYNFPSGANIHPCRLIQRDGTLMWKHALLHQGEITLPASEAQVKLVKKLAVREEVPLSDILAIADIVAIDEMTKQDASQIIDTVMKKNKNSKRKK